MKKFLFQNAIIFSTVFLTLFSVSASAQTVSLSDGTILQGNTNRVGLNIGSIDYWDNGQILNNLIGISNPGFEPLVDRQIWSLAVAGSTTSFQTPNIYDGVPANYWAGATFMVEESQNGGAELGCTGTIASNTGPNYPVTQTNYQYPVFTISTPCAGAFQIGDIITITKTLSPTPEDWWENGGRGGISGSVKGGAQMLSDTTDLCATCGTQALEMVATAAGSNATAYYWYDGSYKVDMSVLMNGTYTMSFWAKAVAGTPTLVGSAVRLSQGGFNCGQFIPKLTGSWAQYTSTCTANESVTSTVAGTVQVSFQVTGGTVYLDNIYFGKAPTSVTNPTVLRDEVIETLQKFYGNGTPGPAGEFRYWLGQNGESLDNWTNPDYAHAPTTTGGGYFIGPGGAGQENLSLEDYLVICQFLKADPYLEVPVTFSNAEAANLIEFLASPAGTTYGSKRAALGQTTPWTEVFDKIHLAFCNECWNGYSFAGQSLPDRSTQPNYEYYYDYSSRARDVFASMRGDEYFSQPSFDLVMGAQTATTSTMDVAIQRARPDSIEIEDYTMSTVNDMSSDAAIWGAAMVEPYLKVTDYTEPKNFNRSVTDYEGQSTCGGAGTTKCKVNIYEWGQGTINGALDQAHLDEINAGAGEGVVMALQPLLNLQYFGILPQNFFSLTEYINGSSIPGLTSKLWGNEIDMGGSTNNLRPTFLGVQLINQSIIGPMFACPIANVPTYNYAGSVNGNPTTPAISNVPYVYSFCFENGKQRSIVLINTDLVNSRSLSLAGSNPPTGTVTQRQYAPSGLDLMNEAPTGTSTFDWPSVVSIKNSTLTSPTSITLPPYSVTALDYTALNNPVAATPTFSPAAATYTTPQAVSILDSTPNTTIYYTVDGTTPTTSSSVYSGPITVGVNETLQALAVENNFTNSTIGSASYIIAPVLPTPTFSVAGGTYTTPQTVTLADASSGVTIFYTTDGTTPTTSSNVYSAPILVSTNETVQAIAVEAGYTNSALASVVYLIAPVLPTPTFSVGTGTYGGAQTVTISEAASGATVYYTVNGSAPTALSTKYTAPIQVSVSETLQAVAIQPGFTNSVLASAAYSISGSTQYINFLSGGFSASSLALNGGASVPTGGFLQITDGGSSESRSAYFSTPVPVQSFVTDFTFQQLNATANGMTFTIQGQGPTALGGPGYSLAYQTIPNSVAVKFDLYNSAGEGSDSTGIYTDGAAPTVPSVDLSSTGINLHSGDIMDAHFVYDGTNLTMTLTDTVTSAAVTEVFPVNIPSIVGGTTAYVGFTGGTGGHSATQNVLSWTYVKSAGSSASAPTVATPTFNVAAGTYTSAQTVTISDTTNGATIYYTTNGSTPTTASAKYAGPITVSSTETVEAIATATGDTNSAVASAAYTISSVLPAPSFSVAAGTYSTSQSVSISDATAGTTIYYTTNGTAPTTSSTVYSGPITVSATETLEAIAVENGYTNSPVASSLYTINPVLPAPTFSVSLGIYTAAQVVLVSDATAGATIYYTTNGTTPTTASAVYTGAITVGVSETLQAIAVKTGYTNSPVTSASYTINPILPAPTFSLAAGTYTSTEAVVLSDATAGTAIYYTTNGTAPTSSSAVYSGAITVAASETIEAIAVKAGYTNSPVATAAYTLNVADPVYINVAKGGFVASALSLNGGATVTGGLLQVTDGGSSEARSGWYSTAVPVQNFVTDFTFQQLNATADGMTFTIQGTGAKAVGAAGGGLGYQGIAKSIAIKFDLHSNAGEGNDSTGLYTNGAVPTMPAIDLTSTAINLHSGDIMDAHMVYDGTNLTMTLTDTVTKGSVTEVFAVNIPSLVGGTTAYVGFTGGTGGSSATQNILTWTYSSASGGTTGAAASAPKFSVAGGAYLSAQTVTITDATAGAYIFYTLNGSTPGASSTRYTQPIVISSTETLKAIAAKTGLTSSPVTTATYTIGEVLPSPTFSESAGSYYGAQKVTISDSKAGVTICFTLDGTTPTSASTHYTAPVAIAKSETLKAIAIETDYVTSPVASAAYTIDTILPAPTASVAAGTYAAAQTVTLRDAAANAYIFYTTNGSNPTASSTRYTGPIQVTASETIHAIAIETGTTSSPIFTAAYVIKTTAATPKVSVAAGTYTSSQTVTLSDASPGVTIYYTTNGTTPTASSTKYTSPIAVTASETVKAIAVGADYFNSAVETAAYTIAIKLPAPAVSLAAGTYYGTQRATVTDSNAGATIYFTLDGTTPTSASTHYTGPVVIAKSESLKAIAIASGYTSSTVTTLAYNIITVLPAPKVSVAAGTYASTQTVTLTDAAPDAMIFYTTNGVAPTASSIRYTIPIQVTATETIRAVAIQSGATASPAIAEAYIIETAAATPTASVASGTYSASQKVTLSDATAGAAIYYTMNGTTPTTSSTKYTAPIAVTASETLKAIAVLAGHTNSGVASVAYTIETPAANPTFSKAAGAYSASQTVTITDATGGATIYYTTNGTVPTTSSTKYTGPIAVAKSEKVQAIAVLAGHTNSGVVAVSYTIN